METSVGYSVTECTSDKMAIFRTHPSNRSVWWRNVGMVSNNMLLAVIAMLHFQNFKLQENKLYYV